MVEKRLLVFAKHAVQVRIEKLLRILLIYLLYLIYILGFILGFVFLRYFKPFF